MLQLILDDTNRYNSIFQKHKGIISLLGYISLYLLIIYIKDISLLKQYENIKQYIYEIFKFIIFISMLYYISHNYIQKTSRRLANISLLLILITNTMLLLLHIIYHHLIYYQRKFLFISLFVQQLISIF